MHLLNTMLSSMLLQRPDDVFHFASSFFFKFAAGPAERRRSTTDRLEPASSHLVHNDTASLDRSRRHATSDRLPLLGTSASDRRLADGRWYALEPRRCRGLLRSLAIAFLPQVLCGPAGVGKTALGRTLCERFPTEFGLAVRHTDRYTPAEPASSVACSTAAALIARRIHRRALPGEIAGVDFHFVLPAEYDLWLSRGEFAVSAAAAQSTARGSCRSSSSRRSNALLDGL